MRVKSFDVSPKKVFLFPKVLRQYIYEYIYTIPARERRANVKFEQLRITAKSFVFRQSARELTNEQTYVLVMTVRPFFFQISINEFD